MRQLFLLRTHSIALIVRLLRAAILALILAGIVPATAQTGTAIEYYYPAWNAYFVTSFPDEVQILDSGAWGGVWKRTGKTFEVWTDSTGGDTPVNATCRFFSSSFSPYSTHFYTPIANECAIAKSSPDWKFEADAFFLGLPDMAGNCPTGSLPLYRLYNNGQGGFPNHRYTDDISVVDQMQAAGWTAEGDKVTSAFACVPAKVLSLVVVPLLYQSPPSTSADAVKTYNDTLPYVTQANQQALFADIAAWWNKETYGRNRLAVTVLPGVTVAGNPACDTVAPANLAKEAANAAGLTYNVLVVIQPYSCWQYYAVTTGSTVIARGGPREYSGTIAHEIGHAVGLNHNAARLPDYQVYGSCYDQMGCVAPTLKHFMSDHKEKLNALTPKACASAALRTLYTYPDAIRCGDYFVDYLDDINTVFVHQRVYDGYGSPYGLSDTTDVARLTPGQSFSGGGYTFTHVTNGQVKISR